MLGDGGVWGHAPPENFENVYLNSGFWWLFEKEWRNNAAAIAFFGDDLYSQPLVPHTLEGWRQQATFAATLHNVCETVRVEYGARLMKSVLWQYRWNDGCIRWPVTFSHDIVAGQQLWHQVLHPGQCCKNTHPSQHCQNVKISEQDFPENLGKAKSVPEGCLGFAHYIAGRWGQIGFGAPGSASPLVEYVFQPISPCGNQQGQWSEVVLV